MNALRISIAVFGAIIYVAGFSGNILTFLIFMQKELRQVSTGLLFLLLTVANTIHLVALIFEFIDSVVAFPIFPSAVFRCQFIIWLQNVSRTICSFLATTISIDRFIRSEYPVLTRHWCTTRNVYKLSVFYCLFSIILFGFFFYPTNVYDHEGYCSFLYDSIFRTFSLYIVPPTRFTLVCVLPTAIMIGCGGRMLYNIKKSRQRVVQHRLQAITTIASSAAPILDATTPGRNGRKQSAALDRALVLMVIMNVIAYITTQIPFNAYAIYYGYEMTKNGESYTFTRSLLLMWSAVYFGVGFYLFSCGSRQFRTQFLTRFRMTRVYQTTAPVQSCHTGNNQRA